MWRNWAGDQRCAPAAIERPGERRGARGGARAGGGRGRARARRRQRALVQRRRAAPTGAADRSSGWTACSTSTAPAGSCASRRGITIHELSARARRARPGDGEPRRHRRADASPGRSRRRRTAPARGCATSPRRSRRSSSCSPTARRSTCSRRRAIPTLFRAARVGARRARRDRRGDAALRAGVHAARRRRAGAARARRSTRFERARRARTTTSSSSSSRTADIGADAHEQPHRRAAAAARRALARTLNDVLLDEPRVRRRSAAPGARFPRCIPQLNRLVTRLAGSSDARRPQRPRSSPRPRLVRFTEMEYALPREHTAEAVRRVLELIERRGFAVPFPIEVRLVAPDDALLSPAHGRATAATSPCTCSRGWRGSRTSAPSRRSWTSYGGRPHWGKRHFQTAETLRPRYPRWDDFQAVRARLDPTGASPTPTPTACSAPSL